MDKRKEHKLWIIFVTMFKIGCFTFGGGFSIIAQLEREFVEKRSWITEEELVDFMSLSRSFPGIMIINMSVMFGYTIAGFWGAVVAAFGLSSPALLAIAIVTYFYSSLRDNIYVAKILNGVRCAVIPIIVSAAWKLKEKALVSKLGIFMMILAFLACAFTGMNKITVVIVGGIAGFILFRRRESDAIS